MNSAIGITVTNIARISVAVRGLRQVIAQPHHTQRAALSHTHMRALGGTLRPRHQPFEVGNKLHLGGPLDHEPGSQSLSGTIKHKRSKKGTRKVHCTWRVAVAGPPNTAHHSVPCDADVLWLHWQQRQQAEATRFKVARVAHDPH